MQAHLETLREREARLAEERTLAFQQYFLAILLGGVLMFFVLAVAR